MIHQYRVPVLILVLGALCSLGLYAQTAPAPGTRGPQSVGDLDADNEGVAVLVHQQLILAGGRSSGPSRVWVGTFSQQDGETPLGIYWRQNLISSLSNRTVRNYAVVLQNNAPAAGEYEYALTGEISDLGSSARIYTRLIESGDSAVIASWHTDLEKNAFLEELLVIPGSSSGTRVSRDAYEPDSRENPVSVEIDGESLDRTIHQGDTDWFVIVPDRAGLLAFETEGDMDTYMELYDSGFSRLDEDDDSGNGGNARIDYPVEAGKSYIVLVRGYSDDTGSYRFSASYIEIRDLAMEPNDSQEQAFAIEVGTAIEGYFHSSSDTDWYRLTLTSGGLLVVHTEGELDTLLGLYNAQGRELAQDDDSGSGNNARFSYTVQEGTYYIKVESYENSRGIYTLRTRLQEPLGADTFEPDDSFSQAKPTEIGTFQRRTFTDQDDVDWVSFSVTRAGYYLLRTKGETNNNLDTYLSLYDSTEKLLAEDDDGGDGYDSYIRIRLEPGTYYIRVHTLESSIPDDHYILGVEEE
jgi:hypothetical protein